MSDFSKISDAEKLRTLANWFDLRDAVGREPGDQDEVQRDLRRIADQLEAAEPLPEIKVKQPLYVLTRICTGSHDKVVLRTHDEGRLLNYMRDLGLVPSLASDVQKAADGSIYEANEY